MIRSMTGCGSAQRTGGVCSVTVELRSVNNRYFDCAVRIPRIYVSMEEPIKLRVQKEVSRGKADVFVTVEHPAESGASITFNRAVTDGYVDALKQMKRIYGLESEIELMSLARMPEVFTLEKAELDTDEVLKEILLTLDEALCGYMEMCRAEGEALKEDVLNRAASIERAVGRIEGMSEKAAAEYREKLLARMKEVLKDTSIDESRILTEAAIYADKTAITEETVRLRSHISQLRDMLERGGEVGRKLDFLIQEFNREANTIGSKANDIGISREVVDIKAEIEKIREQIQNIE
ncbi:MAG: YicC family protein [Oscillospiraceae bacterium]|jgi:uncharacterized protein (TIGR00255 family)|nr:YicC family protein [Oscillospiraceae bacterium]